ncbi:type II toxin-antitoxin system HicB family antitoxin [Nostoc sp.]|uniref:type II toxin-antitoxin system HicB family antitoxin n=1 Tax=Nostoc sp. TaxID=1180 RepID=UPI002FF95EDA
MRQVIVYRDEDGYWIVECPSLKGCLSQGKTKHETLSNIKEAIAGYIAASRRLTLDYIHLCNFLCTCAKYHI